MNGLWLLVHGNMLCMCTQEALLVDHLIRKTDNNYFICNYFFDEINSSHV